jgi:hypothetical protein
MEISPGQTYTARYRMVALDGEPDAELLERLYQDYAHPVQAKVTP